MKKTIMPAIFIGHGSPTNAIESNNFTKAWQLLGQELPKPKAILCLSAHWCVEETLISNLEQPQLIYDFYGFPDELYKVKYPVPGSPELAKQIKDLLSPLITVKYNNNWGIDHGAWVPLKWLFPKADVPVVQLSINYNQTARFHYEIGKALGILREQGILIIASGNIVHNLNTITFDNEAEPYPWATESDELISKLINTKQHKKLLDFRNLGEAVNLAIPTPDHYLPLIYILGLQREKEKMISFAEGVVYKSISMRSYLLK
jgi:4,5-DOPA dioxygenase extradiol